MDDLISRAAAIECAIDAVDDWDGGWNPNRETVIRKYFAEVPAVDAVPVVHARWVADSDGLPVCSVCDQVAMQRLFCDTMHGEWKYDVRLVKTPYCPMCGARMDGGSDG